MFESAEETEDRRPLSGLVVLDLGVAYAGPLACAFLVGLGATVIKIENPRVGGDMARGNPPFMGEAGISVIKDEAHPSSVGFMNRNRGKLSVALDLKSEAGKQVFFDLVAEADVLIENFSSGLAERIGIGYSTLSKHNPRLVYCSISGRGADAADGDKAFALVVEAMSGLMDVTGERGAPPTRIGIPIGDVVAPMFGIIGILSALRKREQTGRGDHVDVAMLDGLAALVAGETFDALHRVGVPWRTGNSVPRLSPFGCYRTADGYVAICAPADPMMRRLVTALDRPELADDPRFRTRDVRAVNFIALDAELEAGTTRLPTDDLMAILERAGIPCGRVRSPLEAVSDPELLRRGAVVPLPNPERPDEPAGMGMGLPIRFNEATAGFGGLSAPGLGEHTQSILTGLLGYTDQRLVDLEADGAFGEARTAPSSGQAR